MQRFEGEIQSVNDGRGAAVALPFEPKAAFGRARAPVRVVVEDHEPFRTTIAGGVICSIASLGSFPLGV